MGFHSSMLGREAAKRSKVSIFSCYSNMFQQIKRLNCEFYIKRILYKALICMIETESQQNPFSWFSIIDDWIEPNSTDSDSVELTGVIRKMKLIFIDRELMAANQKSQFALSSISKLLFVRYFVGLLEQEQSQYLHERDQRISS